MLPNGKAVEIELSSLKLAHSKITAAGWPATDAASLKELSGSPTDEFPVYGSAYAAFGMKESFHLFGSTPEEYIHTYIYVYIYILLLLTSLKELSGTSSLAKAQPKRPLV